MTAFQLSDHVFSLPDSCVRFGTDHVFATKNIPVALLDVKVIIIIIISMFQGLEDKVLHIFNIAILASSRWPYLYACI